MVLYSTVLGIFFHKLWPAVDILIIIRRLRFSSDADIVRLTNACIIIIIIITTPKTVIRGV